MILLFNYLNILLLLVYKIIFNEFIKVFRGIEIYIIMLFNLLSILLYLFFNGNISKLSLFK